jgi:hypothetical protein
VTLLLLLLQLQARIEELLDDKADLEYEIDVVERKVELLREEVRTAVLQGWHVTPVLMHTTEDKLCMCASKACM